jgi:putative transposase
LSNYVDCSNHVKVLKAYKVELDLNNKQATTLRQHVGTARWAFNWGLRLKIDSYKATGKSPSAIDLHRQLNILKKTPKEDGGVPWMYEVSKCAPHEALRDLDRSYKNFFRRCKNKNKKKGFPRFKKRKEGQGSFRLNGTIKVGEPWIQLPRLGKLRLKEQEYLPTDVKVLSATVSQQAGRWFVSIQVEEEHPEPKIKPENIVGVDVGCRKLAVTSDGEIFKNPKALAKVQRRLAYLQRSISRKQKGSNNRRKAVRKVQRQHYKISCVRKDAIHKATTLITKRASTVVIETLNVQGMMRNRGISKSVSDASMAEFHRQIVYKAGWYGTKVIRAKKYYPSSKTCSSCGNVKEDLGMEEVYRCGTCGLRIDRDLNAALNLKSLAGSSSVTACGEDVRPDFFGNSAASMKQEPSTDLCEQVR